MAKRKRETPWVVKFIIAVFLIIIISQAFENYFADKSEELYSDTLELQVEELKLDKNRCVCVVVTNHSDHSGFMDCYLLSSSEERLDSYLVTDVWESERLAPYDTTHILVPAQATLEIRLRASNPYDTPRYFELNDKEYPISYLTED